MAEKKEEERINANITENFTQSSIYFFNYNQLIEREKNEKA